MAKTVFDTPHKAVIGKYEHFWHLFPNGYTGHIVVSKNTAGETIYACSVECLSDQNKYVAYDHTDAGPMLVTPHLAQANFFLADVENLDEQGKARPKEHVEEWWNR